jgi:hypothetical protein
VFVRDATLSAFTMKLPRVSLALMPTLDLAPLVTTIKTVAAIPGISYKLLPVLFCLAFIKSPLRLADDQGRLGAKPVNERNGLIGTSNGLLGFPLKRLRCVEVLSEGSSASAGYVDTLDLPFVLWTKNQ